MQVLHVTPSVGPVYGGPSKVVPELVQAMIREGVTVHIATTDANGKESLEVPLGVPVDTLGVPTYYFARQGSGSYTFSWPLTRWLWQHLDRYDLVHIHGVFAYPTLAASRVAQWLGRPYLITPHDMLGTWCLKYKAWKKSPYLKLIERTTLTGAAALHALGVDEAQDFSPLGLFTPVFVLPNGIEFNEFSSLPPREAFEAHYPEIKGKKIVLFMGRIDPKKGLDLLVKAFAEVTRTNAGAQLCLVIAGPDTIGYRETIEKLIKEENISAQVVFTGMIIGEMKLAALSAADVFVLSSHSEGCSMATLEALAAGCPVIITEGCKFPQVAEFGAGTVIPLDVGHLTKALSKLLENKERRLIMGERGRELILKRYSWPIIAAGMKEIYEDILRGNRKSTAWMS